MNDLSLTFDMIFFGRGYARMNADNTFVKSRHSRLPRSVSIEVSGHGTEAGIVLSHNALKKKDSGQAGMTDSGWFSTFCETITDNEILYR
jgi:hypothetical protein